MHLSKDLFLYIILIASLTHVSCIRFSSTTVPATSSVMLNHERRSSSNFFSDKKIIIKANLKLRKHPDIWRHSHLNLCSYNKNLLIVGQISSTEKKQQLEQLLSSVPEVQKIYNLLEILPPSPLKVRAHDLWLETRVGATYFKDRNIGPNRIKVIVEDSIVYLLGSLSSDEAQHAVNLIRTIKGVKKVVTLFESYFPISEIEDNHQG